MSFSYKDEFLQKIKKKFKPSVIASGFIDETENRIKDFFETLKHNLNVEIESEEALNIIFDNHERAYGIEMEYIGLYFYRKGNVIGIKRRWNKELKDVDWLAYDSLIKKVTNSDNQEFSLELLESYLKAEFDNYLS